ncbi:hypothetical protein, partial [Mesorhizobium mediterraneum]|uniref:hypothetical protein n=1 Tax=Mesorhizobium mediterraneum TaxID=43617 RepID=UPI00197EA82C
ARTGNCDQRRSGAEKKALDVHFLTSSQKLKNGSGYSLLKDSVPCPIPTTEKDAHRAAPSNSTLPMRRRRSTTIVPAKGLCGCYPQTLLHK